VYSVGQHLSVQLRLLVRFLWNTGGYLCINIERSLARIWVDKVEVGGCSSPEFNTNMYGTSHRSRCRRAPDYSEIVSNSDLDSISMKQCGGKICEVIEQCASPIFDCLATVPSRAHGHIKMFVRDPVGIRICETVALIVGAVEGR
jgi:hypothetical protein